MGPEGDAASVPADAVTAADAQLDLDTSPPDAALPPVPRLAVLDQLAFTREVTPGVAPGFDLDARQSDARDAASCFKPDYMSPEGVPGIDNQLAGLVPLLDAFGLGAVEGCGVGAGDGRSDGAGVGLVPSVKFGLQAVALGQQGCILGRQVGHDGIKAAPETHAGHTCARQYLLVYELVKRGGNLESVNRGASSHCLCIEKSR